MVTLLKLFTMLSNLIVFGNQKVHIIYHMCDTFSDSRLKEKAFCEINVMFYLKLQHGSPNVGVK